MSSKLRTVIKLTILISLSAIAVWIYSSRNTKITTDTRFLLDTVVTVSFYGHSNKILMDKTFDLIKTLGDELDRYTPTSQISKINQAAGKSSVIVSPNTIDVVSIALQYARLSEGRFDPSVGPLVDLWGIGSANPRIPEDKEIQEALALIDYTKIKLNKETREIQLPVSGMNLDVGGIAKGWIADQTIRYLKENGVEHALINMGGNVKVLGGKPDNSDFRIGIQNPFDKNGDYLGIFSIKEGSIVTSGDYERYFEKDGQRYHHILDTETGYPYNTGLAAVTVISEKSVDGDALSTLLFALGLEKGIDMAMSLEGIEAVFITKDGNITITPDLASIFKATVQSNIKIAPQKR